MNDPRSPGVHVDERAVVWNTGGTGAADATASRPGWRRAVRVYDEEKLEERATRVSLAVVLVDAFTGGRPRGDPSVSIDGTPADPVLNASGYHVFVDLDLAGDVTVSVDGGAYYADPEDKTETVPAADSVEFELVPTPTYPFPPGTSLVRGRVLDETGAEASRVADAHVRVDDIDRPTTTTSDGEYVVCFAGADPVSIVRDGDTWFVRVNGADPTITVEADGLGSRSITEPIPAGRTTVVDLVYE